MGKNKLTTWSYKTNTRKLLRYAISIEDNATNKVPENFLGTIGLVNDNDGTIVLNPAYRTNNDEFKYYISRILATINPTCIKFSQQKCRDLMSEMIVRYGHETFQFVVPSSRNTTKTNS